MQENIILPHANHRYTLLKQINKTLYGGIYLAQDTLTKQLVALKQVDLVYAMHTIEVRGHLIDDPRQERVIARRLREDSTPSKHILKYLDDFIDEKSLYFVQEYCENGDLHDYVASKPLEKLEEKEALQIFAQIVQGVACLHQKDIAHRDLSLENVLCCSKDTWKIADFGLCCNTLHLHQETVGKPYYMAPEVVEEKKWYDPKAADVWSLGIILFILLTGSPLTPMATKKDPALKALQLVGVEGILHAWQMDEEISKCTLMLLTGMLQMDPSKRPTCPDMLSFLHRFCRLPEEEL